MTPTTINDISDLARILRENPEWAEQIRSVLLTQELLELPEIVARLTERIDRFIASQEEINRSLLASIAEIKQFVAEQREINREQKEFNARIDHFVVEQQEFNARTDRFIAEQRETNREQKEFNARTDRFVVEQRETNREQKEFNARTDRFIAEQKEFNARTDRFIAEQKEFNREQKEFNARIDHFVVEQREINREQKEFNARVDHFIAEQKELNREQKEFNARIDRFVVEQQEFNAEQREINRAQKEFNARTDQRLGNLESATQRMQGQLGRMQGQLGGLLGEAAERRVHANIGNLLHQHADLDLGRINILKSIQHTDPETEYQLVTARRRGLITPQEYRDLNLVDLILAAEDIDADQLIYFAVEVSRTVEENDINRARQRAAILGKALQGPARAVVIGGHIPAPQERQAAGAGVITVFSRRLDGHEGEEDPE